MNLFLNAQFFTTVNHLRDLPDTSAEIAFVGRSNAGKSSAINTLTRRTRLAFVSKTPGRTQHINFFRLSNGAFAVDLPGYGYAKVPEEIRKHWVELLGRYLKERRQLRGLVVVMDCRHPMRDIDIRMLDFAAAASLPVHILLSKSDKLSANQAAQTLLSVKKMLEGYKDVSVQLFSSLKKTGIEEVSAAVLPWLSGSLSQGEDALSD